MSGDLLQVGVTGGIGAGKSTVCKIFSILGIKHYNADQRARWLMENHQELIDRIKQEFGKQSYSGDRLNREYMAAEVFNKNGRVETLNSLVHPVVAEDYQGWLLDKKDHPYIIKEAALLFETGSYKQLDLVINVFSPLPLRLKRIQARDPFRKKEEIEGIIKKQMSDNDRQRLSQYHVYNDETQSVIEQALELHEKFNQLAVERRPRTL